MNLTHFGAIAWLRWRLAVNQINRLTPLSRWFLMIVLAGSMLLGFASFLTVLSLGSWLLPETWTEYLFWIWNCLIIAFLLMFFLGGVAGFRSEQGLSLQKLLPLPMSPFGAFLVNVFGLLLARSTMVFAPPMLALCLVISWRYGAQMLLSLPLLGVFLVMSAALLMQLRNWLSTICEKKWGSLLLWGIGIFLFLAVLSVPVLALVRAIERENEITPEMELEAGELRRQITSEEFSKVLLPFWQVTPWLPPFWLAFGVDSLAKSNFWRAFASLAGMTVLTALSLDRGYRGALRMARRESSSQCRLIPAAEKPGGFPEAGEAGSAAVVRSWLDPELAGVNRRVAAVALLTLRNEFRKPGLILEYICRLGFFLALGVGLVWLGRILPSETRGQTLLALGICWLAVCFGMQGFSSYFTWDGTGFRALLLAPLGEEEILLGKNVASFFRTAVFCGLASIFFLLALSLSWSHFLACLFQMLSLFLVVCLVSNLVAILFPSSTKLEVSTAGFMYLRLMVGRLVWLGYLPLLLPLGLELLAERAGVLGGVPIYLMGAVGYCLILALLYRPILRWEGDLLRRRKWKVLESVTNLGN